MMGHEHASTTRRGVAAAITAIALTAAAGPAMGATDYSGAIASIEAQVPGLMAAGNSQGLDVALVDGNRLVWSRGFGWADREAGRQMTDRTLVHIGSITKTMGAIATMQLVEQGRVRLDDPVSKYVPDFTLLDAAQEPITVRSVLDHHSGVPGDVFNGAFTNGVPYPGYRDWMRTALARMLRERPINTEWAYNNSGFVLLADLVENVSGMGIEQYMQQHLFGPAGMRSAHIDDTIPTNAQITRNYMAQTNDAGEVTGVPVTPREYVNASTAGSVMASARDMARYASMLLAQGKGANGRVLTATTVNAMWRPQTQLAIDSIAPVRFGLGFAVTDSGMGWAGPVRWHDGGTTYQGSMLKLLPSRGLGVFVSSNTAETGGVSATVANLVLTQALQAKTGMTAPPATTDAPAAPVALPEAQLLAHVGRYAGTDSITRVDMSGDGTGVVLRVHPGTPAEVAVTYRPQADGWFRSDEEGHAPIRFATLGGRRVMISRRVGGPKVVQLAQGERIPMRPVSPAWRARLGTYRAVNRHPNATVADSLPVVVLDITDGVLGIGAPGDAGRRALVVANDALARTFGMGPTMGRDQGDGVFASTASGGRPAFTWMGVRYVREP